METKGPSRKDLLKKIEALEKQLEKAEKISVSRQQQFLSEISHELSALDNIEETMKFLGEKIARYFGVQWCVFSEVMDGETAVSSSGWNSPEVTSLNGVYRMRDFLTDEQTEKHNSGGLSIVNNTQDDPNVNAATYGALNIHAFIIVPLLQNNNWTFLLSIIDTKPRVWRPNEIELIKEVTNRIWTRLEKARIEEALRQNEEKFRIAFNSLDQGYALIEVLYDKTGKAVDLLYIETNPAFEKQIGFKADGKKISELVGEIEPYWYEAYDRILKKRESERIEFKTHALGETWFTVHVSPIGEADAGRVVAIFDDITKRKRAEQQQAYLLNLNEALRPIADPVELEGKATQTAMNYFKADRCYYCEIEGNNAIIRRDASQAGLPSVAGTYLLSSFAIFKKVVEEGRPFIVHDANTADILDEPLRELCLALQVISFIDTPVVKNGRVVGVLCLVQSTPRNWTETEIELAIETSERIWAAVERAKAEEALRKSQQQLALSLEAAKMGSYEWSSRDGGVHMSENSIRIFGLQPDHHFVTIEEGFKITHPDESEKTKRIFEELAPGGKEYYNEYRVFRPIDGKMIWIAERGKSSKDEQTGVLTIRGVHWDITDKKNAEVILRQTEERKEFLFILSDSLRHLTDPLDIQEMACRLTGEFLQVNRAGYAELEGDEIVIKRDYNNGVPSIIGRFPKSTFGKKISEIFNKIGTFWEENIPLLTNLSEMEKQACEAVNMVAYLGTTLYKGGKIAAAFALHHATPRHWTRNEISLIEEVAERIWATVERAKTEEALNKANEQLKYQIAERTAELLATEQLQKISIELITEKNAGAFQEQVLDAAMQIMGADFASMQIYIPERKELQLLASCNLHPRSKKFWERVTVDSLTTSAAVMRELQRKINADINADETLTGSDDLIHYHLNGIRSLQSTPLIARDGRFIGVISTCWRKVHQPSSKDLRLFDILARQAADLIERKEQENILQQLVELRTNELEYISYDLKKSKEHFAMLFKISPVAESLTRVSDGIIIDVNPSWEQLFDLKKANVVGKTTFELKLANTEDRKRIVKKVEQGNGNLLGEELTFKTWDGKTVNTYISIAKITLNGVDCLLTAYFDITSIKKAEAQMLKSTNELREKNRELEAINEELESFNFIASHDLQEPLRKIQTFLPLVEKNLSDETKWKSYFDKTMVASERMSELIQSVLNYSRITKTQQTDFTETDLNKVLSAVKSDFEVQINERNAIIRCEKLPTIRAIKSQMEQLFSNLISNAIKFSKEKPVISITVKMVTGKDIVIGDIAEKNGRFKKATKALTEKNKFIELRFTDNGIGFEPQYSKKIFDLFQRLHSKPEYEGTGIGLSIVKKIVTLHNGFIMAQSELGKGTTFTVWLPLEG